MSGCQRYSQRPRIPRRTSQDRPKRRKAGGPTTWQNLRLQLQLRQLQTYGTQAHAHVHVMSMSMSTPMPHNMLNTARTTSATKGRRRCRERRPEGEAEEEW